MCVLKVNSKSNSKGKRNAFFITAFTGTKNLDHVVNVIVFLSFAQEWFCRDFVPILINS